MKSIEAVLRIISAVFAIIFFILFSQPNITLDLNLLAILTGGYLLFLLLKKHLVRVIRGATWHLVVELIELVLVLLICKNIPTQQALLLCSVYLIRALLLCNRRQVFLLMVLSTVGYLSVTLINLSWQLIIDVDTIAFLITSIGFLILPPAICRWCVNQVKKGNSYLEDTKNLLVVKQRLLDELEQSREKTRVYAEELAYVAKVDYLTRLYNRKYLHEYIEYIVNDLNNEPSENIVIADIFVSNIAIFNEESEFGESEKIAEGVAFIIESVIDKDDVAARYDGCEFVIVFHGKTKKQVEQKVKEIKIAFEKPREEHPEEWLLHIEFGITTISSRKDTISTIIQRARKDRKLRGRG